MRLYPCKYAMDICMSILCVNGIIVFSVFDYSRLYSSCMLSSLLHGSETWPARKENEVALLWVEMRMVRWMCDVNVKDRFPNKEMRERLGIDDNLGSTAKQVAMIDQRELGERLCKKSVEYVN